MLEGIRQNFFRKKVKIKNNINTKTKTRQNQNSLENNVNNQFDIKNGSNEINNISLADPVDNLSSILALKQSDYKKEKLKSIGEDVEEILKALQMKFLSTNVIIINKTEIENLSKLINRVESFLKEIKNQDIALRNILKDIHMLLEIERAKIINNIEEDRDK